MLAVDTSSPHGGVSLADPSQPGAEPTAAALPDPSRQASDITTALDVLGWDARLGVERLTAVIVGEGPGSFTGVRVGAAVAKALAHVLEIPLCAVPSLASAAVSHLTSGEDPDAAETRYVLFDARSDRVYGACYQVGPGGVVELVAPHGGTVGEVLEGTLPEGTVFCGDGATKHRALLETSGFRVEGPPAGLPTPHALLTYHRLHPELEPVPDLATWEPRYVRASNAEREWGG